MTLFDIEPDMARTADISPCGRYRYTLGRRWGEGESVNFIMLNPSTADASIDDPTIRRCIGFAKSWGYGALVVTNLCAFRATDPKAMLRELDPIGPKNNEAIRTVAESSALVVCAWGSCEAVRTRANSVLTLLALWGVDPNAIRLTKDGHPAHPLYLPANLKPVAMS